MTVLSKKEQREMIARNYGLPLDYQERVVKVPHLVFAKAGWAVRAYATKEQVVNSLEQFCIRMCLLVFDQVKLGCLRVEEPSLFYVNLSPAEKSAIMLAGAYCQKSALRELNGSVNECVETLKLAIRGGELVSSREYLEFADLGYIDAFCLVISIFGEIFSEPKQQNQIDLAIKEVMANR